jgi:hypothetical protein
LDTPAVTARALARRWLLSEFDAEVALPVGYLCNSLGLDAGRLAAAVRSRATP